MQTPFTKFLQTKSGVCAVFQQENGNIFCRILQGNEPGNSILLAEKTRPYFSLCRYQDYTYLLFVTQNGELTLSASADLCHWEPRILQQQSSLGTGNYFMIPQQDAFHLIYHKPIYPNGIHALLYAVFRQGTWQKPYCLDHFLPMPNIAFQAKRLKENHVILYYPSGKTAFSARELLLSPFTVGSLSPLIQTSSPAIDVSICESRDRIHILYLVRNLFRTQVLYRYRQTTAISRPRLIWEGIGCDTCMIFQSNHQLSLLWTAGGETFRCVSENDGHTFGPVESLTEFLPFPTRKGELVSDSSFAVTSETLGSEHGFFLPSSAAENRQISENTLHAAEESSNQINASQSMDAYSQKLFAVNEAWQKKVTALESEMENLKQENETLRAALTPQTTAEES